MDKRFDSADFIELVKTDNRIALEAFYNRQKNTFVNWANTHFDLDADTVLDVYQDAIVTLYFNVNSGKIREFTHSVEAYLFGIARNLLLKQSVKSRKVDLYGDIVEFDALDVDFKIYDRINQDHFNYELDVAFKDLTGKCKEIIILFYYNKFSLESIAEKLNYNNSDTVKARKNQCMKKLKKILANKL